jgi:hypothetical protein
LELWSGRLAKCIYDKKRQLITKTDELRDELRIAIGTLAKNDSYEMSMHGVAGVLDMSSLFSRVGGLGKGSLHEWFKVQIDKNSPLLKRLDLMPWKGG